MSSRAIGLYGAVFLLSSCTDAVTDVAPPTPQPLAPSYGTTGNTTTHIAAGSISAPGYPAGSATPTVPIGTLPDSQWVVIDVQGTVLHARNEDCATKLAPAYRWGTWPMDGVQAGPLHGMGKAAVFAPNGATYTLLPVNGTHETATHARVLVGPRAAGQIGARHNFSVPSCGDPTAGVYYKGYFLYGGYDITLTAVTHPLDLTTPDYVVKGESGQFTAAATADLRFLNASGMNPEPAGKISWYFYPNDTLPTPATGGWYITISQCHGLQVCEYAPSVSGRVRASGYVEGLFVSRKSDVIRVVDPCDTGDPVIDNEEIQDALRTIWQASNAKAPYPDRREQGGWITSDGQGGFDFYQFPTEWGTPCTIDFPEGMVVPAGVVAWVHTHPNALGELTTGCERQRLWDGSVSPVPFTYTGDPSEPDDEITLELRQQLNKPDFVGYILDADGIIRFTGDDTPATVQRFGRCAY